MLHKNVKKLEIFVTKNETSFFSVHIEKMNERNEMEVGFHTERNDAKIKRPRACRIRD